MVKGKLILICQYGGEFETKDDGSLSYNGGEANAIAINPETQYDDLKFKLAELCDVDYNSVCVKYFLPGNKRTLITLSNDKDLKRMYGFHGDSVTADVFITGKAGFDREAFTSPAGRENGIKLAESVPTASPAVATTPVPVSNAQSPVTGAADETAHNPVTIDMSATPADTVKKRRRAASRKTNAKRPAIVVDSGNSEEETRKILPRKKSVRKRKATVVTDFEYVEQQLDDDPWHDDPNFALNIFNPNNASPEELVASWKDGITGVGQEFNSVHEFRDALQKYAIAHRFTYRLKKNETSRVSGMCTSEGCSWRIHASWVQSSKVFKIKKMNESHTCGGEARKPAHPTRSWLVSIIKDKLRESPLQKPKEMADSIRRDFGIELNYTQVWRGIEHAKGQLQGGSYKQAYNQLPWFCDKLLEVNPGSFVKYVIDDDGKFQRLFVCFHASIHGFQNGCRPLIFLDSTSMKSKYHEILLTATALDGDDGIFPVAFSVVDIENEESWHWFLEQLKSAVSTSRSITFVSDREKRLMKPVLEVFENAHHGYCIYNLLDDFMKNLKGPFHGDAKFALPENFLAAACAAGLDGFRMCAEQIKRISPNAYDWIMEIEPEYWTNAAFKGERYHQIAFDVADSYSNWIDEVGELTIIQKLETLQCKMMELINNRRMDSSQWSTELTASKEEWVKQESQKALYLRVLFSSDTLFEVHDEYTNVVDIEKRNCSCLLWKATGLPCRHAIAVFKCTNRSVYDYCSTYFTADSFRLTYSKSINPIGSIYKLTDEENGDSEAVTKENTDLEAVAEEKGDSEVVTSEEKAGSKAVHVLPPSTIRRGRPSQPKRKWTTPEIIQRTVTCTKCKGVGHNKITCKETS